MAVGFDGGWAGRKEEGGGYRRWRWRLSSMLIIFSPLLMLFLSTSIFFLILFHLSCIIYLFLNIATFKECILLVTCSRKDTAGGNFK